MKAVITLAIPPTISGKNLLRGRFENVPLLPRKNGMTVLRHYIDRAFSAKTDNRPEFQRMIKDSKEKLFDVVLVWKLDRFARNRYDSAQYKTILKKMVSVLYPPMRQFPKPPKAS